MPLLRALYRRRAEGKSVLHEGVPQGLRGFEAQAQARDSDPGRDMKMEVRCCCNAGQLLGWIDMPPPRPWQAVRFALMVPVPSAADNRDGYEETIDTETLTLGVAAVVLDGRVYDAIKADGITIGKLRLIHGFEENK
jgi:hypothetical protein